MKKTIFGTLLMGAFLFASMSMFVSCKDYDDDINKNSSDIAALQSQISSLETALAQAKSEATAAHALYATKTEVAAKADPSDVAAVQKALNDAVSALSTEVKALVTAQQLTDAIAAAQATLQAAIDGKADKADVEALALQIAAIDPQLNALKADLLAEIANASTAANNNIAAQQTAIEALQAALKTATDANASQDEAIKALQAAIAKGTDSEALSAVVADVKTLQATVAALPTQAAVDAISAKVTALESAKETLTTVAAQVETAVSDVAAVKEQMATASKAVDDAIAAVNLLTVFVDKRLTSLVFDPQFYWGGIESMEAPRLTYWPLGYTTPYDASCKNGDQVVYTYLNNIDAATYPGPYDVYLPIEASYFINPSTASVDDITSLEVVSYDKNTYTRAAACDPKVVSYSAKNGLLTAKIAVDYWTIARTEEMTFDNTGTGWKYNGDTWEWVSTKAVNSTVNTQEGVVTVLATQARLKGETADTTVTSDFAAVAPSTITGFRIVDNAPYILNVWDNCAIPYVTSKFHVYTTANQAVNQAFTHKLFWNDKVGIDLDDIIEVHAFRTLGTSGATEGEFKLEDLKERYGLELRYELLEYLSGGNGTEQSLLHATLDPATNVIKATGINGEQTKASIGREPLVKIELIDTNNGNAIVSIGYIKFQIAAEQPDDVTLKTYEGNAYLLCGGTKLELSWDQVERDILANNTIKANGMSKSTFEDVYSISPNTTRLSNVGTPGLSGQTYIRVNGVWTPVAGTWQNYLDYIITYKADVSDWSGNQTNVITCEFDVNKVRQILAKRDKDNDMIDEFGNKVTLANIEDAVLNDVAEIEIAARLYDRSNSGYPDVYVPFKLKVSKLHLTLNKIPDYWYKANTAAAKTGFDEIHVNVDAYGQAGANISHFQGDLLSTLYGNKLQISTALLNDKFDQVGKSMGYIPATGYEIGMPDRLQIVADGGLKTYLAFKQGSVKDEAGQTNILGTIMTGDSGAKYFVYPSANHMLSAFAWNPYTNQTVGASQNIVEMIVGADPTNTEKETVFKVLETAYLKDLLNLAPHTDLAKTLTAMVGVTVHEGNCEVPVILTNPLFNVKFLRPIYVPKAKNAEFTDAKDGGNIKALKDCIELKDWRDQWSDDTKYRTYYGVNSITADLANVTTNLGGGTLGQTLLSDITSEVTLYLQKSGWNTELVYNNNNLNVGEFTINVPLIIQYYWGQFHYAVDIKVKHTVNNGVRAE